MPNVRDQKKSPEEHNLAVDPYALMKQHEQSLQDFTRCEKAKILNLKNTIKSLTEETKKMQQGFSAKDDIIKELREEIEVKEKEIVGITEAKNILGEENKMLKLNLLTNERKFSNLEITYDENMAALHHEKEKMQQYKQTQTNAYNTLNEELTSSRQKLEDELRDKSRSLTEWMEKFQKLSEDFDNYKVRSSQELEKNLAILKDESADLNKKLFKKDEELAQIKKEKCEMEEAKNKIIDELHFKINKIERIFEQPLQRVQPQSNLPSSSPNHVAPFQFSDQTAVTVSNTNIVATLPTVSCPDAQQSARAKRNGTSGETLNGGRAAISTTISTRSSKRRFTSYQRDDQSSDTDSDISVVPMHFFNNIHNDPPCTPSGFKLPKRPLRGSDESSKTFDNLKRSKYD